VTSAAGEAIGARVVGKEIGITHGWHGFRRGVGTNLKRLGVDLKTIQNILRHAHIATTADIYVKDVSEDAIAAMQLLEKRVDL
jgi:integrase